MLNNRVEKYKHEMQWHASLSLSLEVDSSKIESSQVLTCKVFFLKDFLVRTIYRNMTVTFAFVTLNFFFKIIFFLRSFYKFLVFREFRTRRFFGRSFRCRSIGSILPKVLTKFLCEKRQLLFKVGKRNFITGIQVIIFLLNRFECNTYTFGRNLEENLLVEKIISYVCNEPTNSSTLISSGCLTVSITITFALKRS